jgi:hypothetical protein
MMMMMMMMMMITCGLTDGPEVFAHRPRRDSRKRRLKIERDAASGDENIRCRP